MPSEESRQKAEVFLREHDTYEILQNRFSHLRNVVAMVLQCYGDMQGQTLLEFGGVPFRSRSMSKDYNPEVSHVLSLHRKEMDILFRSFDAEYKQGILGMSFQQLEDMREGESLPEIHRKYPNLASLLKEALAATIETDYNSVVELAKSTNAVIFSNHTLNYDRLSHRQFWELPGLHIHSGLFVELCHNRGIGYQEALDEHLEEKRRQGITPERQFGETYTLEGKSMYDVQGLIDLEQFKQDPTKHTTKFKKKFTLQPGTKICCELSGEVITYYWMNELDDAEGQ